MLPVSRATGRWAPRRSALSATTTWWLAGWRPRGLIRTAHAIRAPDSLDELLARAFAHQDPHVLKFSEACAREHAHNPDAVYLLAARHVLDQLQAW
jgi:hypothetical protein